MKPFFSNISSALQLSNIKKRTFQFRYPILVILLPILILWVLYSDRENVFTIKGETEAFSISLSDNTINQWDVSNAYLITDFLDTSNKNKLPIDSYLFPSKNSAVRLQIIQENIPYLLITITAIDENSVGDIETSEGVQTLDNYAELKVPIKSPITLPFEGNVRIGEDVGVGVDRILLSGGVKVIEKQLFSDSNYVAGEFDFDSGDRVELFVDREETKLSTVKGFVRVANADAINFTVHGEGKVLKVNRLGSEGYQITPNIWPRLTKDPIVAALTTFFATLFLFMEFIDLYIKFALSYRNKNEQES